MESDNLIDIAFIVFALGAAVWLTAMLTAIYKLSWAKLRKLDPQKDSNLIKHATHYLENRSEYRVMFRFLASATLAVLSIVIFRISYHLSSQTIPVISTVVYGLIAATVFVTMTEVLGAGFPANFQLQLLRLSSRLIRLIHLILIPFVRPLINMQNRLKQLNDDGGVTDKETTADEIISLVEMDAHEPSESSTLEADERRMIRGIFDLDETPVKEIMTPRVDLHALKSTATVSEAKKKIIECGHSRIPVYQNRIDEIVGLVYAKDLLDEDKLREVDSLQSILHPPIFVPETKNIGDLLDEFRQNRIHIAVIIDEYGGTAGIVTFEDILEEIVGEIQDEYDIDEETPGYIFKEDGALIVDARMPIDEVNVLLKLSISEKEEFDTIGGYVSSEIGRIPKTNEVVSVGNVQARILVADARRISKLKLTKIEPTTGPDEVE